MESHLSYCQPRRTSQDSGMLSIFLPTDSVFVTHLLAMVYLPPLNEWEFHGLLWVCAKHGKQRSSAAQAPGASCLTPPSSHRKQCPLQGLFSVMFTHLCTADEFAVWSSSRHSWEVLSCTSRARRLWCASQKTSSGQISAIQTRYGGSWPWPRVNKPVEHIEWGISKQVYTLLRHVSTDWLKNASMRGL